MSEQDQEMPGFWRHLPPDEQLRYTSARPPAGQEPKDTERADGEVRYVSDSDSCHGTDGQPGVNSS